MVSRFSGNVAAQVAKNRSACTPEGAWVFGVFASAHKRMVSMRGGIVSNNNFYEIYLPNGELRRVHLKDGVPDGGETIMQRRPRDPWTKAGRWRMEQMLVKALNRDPKDDTPVDVPWTIHPTPRCLLPDNVVPLNPNHQYRPLEKTESVQHGDLVKKRNTLRLVPLNHYGQPAFRNMFRPTRLQAPKWRFLDAGETIQTNDEFLDGRKWRKCHSSIGHRVRKPQKNRRGIDVPTTRKKEATLATATELFLELGPVKQ